MTSFSDISKTLSSGESFSAFAVILSEVQCLRHSERNEVQRRISNPTSSKEILHPINGVKNDDTPIPSKYILKENSRLDLVIAILPGVSTEINLIVEIQGENAQVNISGLYICREAERVGINIDLCHKVPGCTSRQLFKGIVSGTSKVKFNGKITVVQDAQKTEAYQENHNLLLSDTALVRTLPQLEIYADDVKCSHGAAIGRLDEQEQFYMRSRGIPEAEARALQMLSFLAPVLSSVPEQGREELLALVEPVLATL